MNPLTKEKIDATLKKIREKRLNDLALSYAGPVLAAAVIADQMMAAFPERAGEKFKSKEEMFEAVRHTSFFLAREMMKGDE